MKPIDLDRLEKLCKAHSFSVSLYPSTILSLISEIRSLRTKLALTTETLGETAKDRPNLISEVKSLRTKLALMEKELKKISECEKNDGRPTIEAEMAQHALLKMREKS